MALQVTEAESTLRQSRILPRTIRGLAISFAALSAGVTIILGMATLYAVHHELEKQIDQRIYTESEALRQYERDRGFAELANFVMQREHRAMPGSVGYLAGVDDRAGRSIGYILLDADGHRRAGAPNAQIPAPGWSEFLPITRSDGSTGDAQALNSKLESGGRLIVIGDRAMLHRMDRLLLQFFATAFGVALFVGGIITLFFGRIVRQRLAAIEASAQAIIDGDLSQRLARDGSGIELDRLASLLNTMLDRIGALVGNLRSVSNALAHDLRTPLSRLRAKLEKASAMTTDPAQRDLLDEAVEEGDDLLNLFSGMLAIAEIEGHTLRARFVPVDLALAAEEIAEAHRPALEDGGIRLVIRTDPAQVSGDRMLLQRLVGNLLDNALHHAAGANEVVLAVRTRGAVVVVSVTDDGCGIPENDMQRVFDPLVRLDPSRTKAGHGLGLSIVAAIASAHGGTLSTVRSAKGGLRVELGLPAMRKSGATAD